MDVPKVSIFGVPISKLGFRDTIKQLVSAVESRKPHQVITANPIMVMAAIHDPSYMQLMKNADFIVPDGAGVVWAAGYVGNPVQERVPGIEIMQELLKLSVEREWKVFLLGASPEVIGAAAEKIRLQHPTLQLAGVRDGYFGAEQDQAVIEEIRAASPDLLFVGRSADKQEPWISQHKEALGVPVIMGVGGSFDVISGKLKRAPKLFRKMRLEWFYRLLQEPARFPRMLVLPKFALKVIREKENVQKA
jgi:N-acetylglucosaminyldiphosphoundecaprenol N-acetyl-beta-D-mannosaminyltransferase